MSRLREEISGTPNGNVTPKWRLVRICPSACMMHQLAADYHRSNQVGKMDHTGTVEIAGTNQWNGRLNHLQSRFLSPSLATVLRRGKKGVGFVPRSADGRIGSLFPLRLLFRRLGSGGTSDPCLRCVDSRVGSPDGAGEVAAAALWWNNSAGAPSPPRRGHLWRSRRASGGACSQIR